MQTRHRAFNRRSAHRRNDAVDALRAHTSSVAPGRAGFTGRTRELAELDARTACLGHRIRSSGRGGGHGRCRERPRWANQAADRFPDGGLLITSGAGLRVVNPAAGRRHFSSPETAAMTQEELAFALADDPAATATRTAAGARSRRPTACSRTRSPAHHRKSPCSRSARPVRRRPVPGRGQLRGRRRPGHHEPLPGPDRRRGR